MKWLRNNSLSVVFLALFLFSLVGQIGTGLHEHNQEITENGGQPKSVSQYLTSGHFLQATFENWESEFFQMGLFVLLTIFLYQKGSSESKDPDKEEEVDEAPNPRKKNAPWPVKKGGLYLWFYQNSLSTVFFSFFLLSFLGHWYGSLKDYNEEQLVKHLPTQTAWQFLSSSKLWFESFQNWQSEFLSIFAMVVLSIFLRQKGSPQSKPVVSADRKTAK